jgi:hypothetical protein
MYTIKIGFNLILVEQGLDSGNHVTPRNGMLIKERKREILKKEKEKREEKEKMHTGGCEEW